MLLNDQGDGFKYEKISSAHMDTHGGLVYIGFIYIYIRSIASIVQFYCHLMLSTAIRDCLSEIKRYFPLQAE